MMARFLFTMELKLVEFRMKWSLPYPKNPEQDLNITEALYIWILTF